MVQSTNDFSTLSKVSAVSMGYFTDGFQKYFVSRTCRRSPLIHRGYCVRAQAVTHCLQEFFQDTSSSSHRQVLSLGCGFDSLYFRLCERRSVEAPGTTCIWEVDFPAVVKRKRLLIDQTEALRSQLKNPTPPTVSDENDSVVLDSEDYRLIGVDLSDVGALDSVLEGAGIIWDCPTLLLAEVVLCYMDPARSGDVIGWAARRFPHSRFLLYEQFFPDDAFGQVMVNHFQSLNSALHSVSVYPRLQDQEKRFLQKGWPRCRVMDMNQFSATCLPEAERIRVESLEPFDEFEELHLKCSHYFILVASQGDLTNTLVLRPVTEDFTVLPPPTSRGTVVANPLSPSVPGLRRFGHRSCLVSSQTIMTTGGFGDGNGKHQRLREIHLLQQKEGSWGREETTSQWDGRLLHSLTPLMSGAFLVLGGRFSPCHPADGAQILTYNRTTGALTVTQRDLCQELRRWRHTATEVSLSGLLYVFVFGGRSVESPALQEAMFLVTEDMSIAQVSLEGVAPSGCHSHSSCGWAGGAVISGGLLGSGAPTGSITILRPQHSHFTWERLDTNPPLTPRYSHSSHVIADRLILVGGVWIHAQGVPGITLVDLISGQVCEYKINSTLLEWPLMIHGHSSVLLPDKKRVVVLGGGGTCFSFGTHLNQQPVVLEVPCTM